MTVGDNLEASIIINPTDSKEVLAGVAAGLDNVAASGDKAASSLGYTNDELLALAKSAKDVVPNAGAVSGSLDKVATASSSAASESTRLNEALLAQRAELASNSAELSLYASATERAAATQNALTSAADMGAAQRAIASSNLGGMYTGMAKLEALGTPAILKAATWTILGAGGIAYEGIKQFMNLNKELTQVITQAGVNPKSMPFLTSMAESVAKLTGVNLSDVANSIYRVASGTASWNNGLGATHKQLTNITTEVAKLGVIGGVSGGAAFEQASRVVTSMINANMSDVGRDPRKAAALINAAVGSGDMRLGDLVPGLGRGLLQSARANNVSAKDALAWVATLTSMGTTASVAGNYVKTGMNLLANPSAQGTAALALLGIHPGEMQGLMSGKGGLQAAIATLVQGMHQFRPGNVALYRDKIGNVRPGGSGFQAAVNKLQTWGVGELPATFIKDWTAGKLNAKDQAYANDLILTKAFGGSKQFATIAALTNNPALLTGIEQSITRKDNLQYLTASERRAENTPAMQFQIALRALQVDLVNAGKVLYPPIMTLTHGFVDMVSAVSKIKPLLYELGAVLLGIVTFAAIHKVAQIGMGITRMIGGGLSHLDPKGNNLQHFRNAYLSTSDKVMAGLGADLNSSSAKIALSNDGVITALDRNSAIVGGGSFRGAGGLSGASSAERTAAIDAASIEQQKLQKFRNELANLNGTGGSRVVGPIPPIGGSNYRINRAYDAYAQDQHMAAFRSGLYSGGILPGYGKNMGGGIHALSDAQLNEKSSSMRRAQHDYLTNSTYATSNVDSIIAENNLRNAVGSGVTNGADELNGLRGGLLSKLGGGLRNAMGMVGGPVGLAMIAATVLPMAIPYAMKLGGLISGWLGNANYNKASYWRAKGGIVTRADAVASESAALKALHATELYNKKTKKWYLDPNSTTSQILDNHAALMAYERSVGITKGTGGFASDRLSYNQSVSTKIKDAIQGLRVHHRHVAGGRSMIDFSSLNTSPILAAFNYGPHATHKEKLFYNELVKMTHENKSPEAIQKGIMHLVHQHMTGVHSNVAELYAMAPKILKRIDPTAYLGQRGLFDLYDQTGLLSKKNIKAMGPSASMYEMALHRNELTGLASRDTKDAQSATGNYKKALLEEAKQSTEAANKFSAMLTELKKEKAVKIASASSMELAKDIATTLAPQGLAQEFATGLGLQMGSMKKFFAPSPNGSGKNT
jgi:hypothetical protein